MAIMVRGQSSGIAAEDRGVVGKVQSEPRNDRSSAVTCRVGFIPAPSLRSAQQLRDFRLAQSLIGFYGLGALDDIVPETPGSGPRFSDLPQRRLHTLVLSGGLAELDNGRFLRIREISPLRM